MIASLVRLGSRIGEEVLECEAWQVGRKGRGGDGSCYERADKCFHDNAQDEICQRVGNIKGSGELPYSATVPQLAAQAH